MSVKHILKKLDNKQVIREIMNVPTVEDIPRMKSFLAQNMIMQGLLDVELSETETTFELSNGQSFNKPTDKRLTTGTFCVGKHGYTFTNGRDKLVLCSFPTKQEIEELENGFIISYSYEKRQVKYTLQEVGK